MTETVSKLIAHVVPPHIGMSEAFLIAASIVLSGSIVIAMHFWLDVPVPVAILSMAGCLTVLAAASAALRRAAAADAVDADIAELRAEIAVLRRSGAPNFRDVDAAVTDGLSRGKPRRAGSGETRAPVTTSLVSDRPTALLPAPSPVASILGNASQCEPKSAANPERSSVHSRGATARYEGLARQNGTNVPTGRAGIPQAFAGEEARMVSSAASRMPRSERGNSSPTAAFPATPSEPPARSPSKELRHAEQSARTDSNGGGTIDLEAMQALIEQLAAHRNQSAADPQGAQQQTIASEQWHAQQSATAVATGQKDVPARKASSIGPGPATRLGSHDGGDSRQGGDVALLGHVTLISEALEAKRMDVFLHPLVGLGDRRARHLELSVQLVTQGGHAYAENELHRIAAGTGLLARIDAAKLAKAIGVLSRFKANGSRARLFSAVAAESLVDDNFADAFSDILRFEPGDEVKLVLSFAQAEARNFTAAHWQAITQIWKLGLTFALAEVTDLDMDFELLKAHGFDFIKLDAAVFLEGLPTPNGHVPAADICRHLAGLGLILILGDAVAE